MVVLILPELRDLKQLLGAPQEILALDEVLQLLAVDERLLAHDNRPRPTSGLIDLKDLDDDGCLLFLRLDEGRGAQESQAGKAETCMHC